MAISYNKSLAGVGLAIVALAGGALLGLGMAGGQIGVWGGHTWQILTGGSMLGAAGIGGTAFLIYMCTLKEATSHAKRDVSYVRAALKGDPRTRIWTYAYNGSEKVLIGKNGNGVVFEHMAEELKKRYKKVSVI